MIDIEIICIENTLVGKFREEMKFVILSRA